MKVNDTRPQNAIGMSRTRAIVQGRAKHGWQPYESDNDNGVDGIIIFRKKGVDTGQIVSVQVKCGSPGGYYSEAKVRPNKFGVNLGETHITKHRQRWNSVSGPMIMVYVDNASEKAWWTDLKNDESYIDENKNLILFDKRRVFERHSFGNFKKLKGHIYINPNYESILIPNSATDYLNLGSKVSLKQQARNFYNNWSKQNVSERTHQSLGEITISRIGWRHITRSGRNQNRIHQSLQLIGAAKEIITKTNSVFQTKVNQNTTLKDGTKYLEDYLGLRAKCKFEHRHSSLIQVTLKRKRWIGSSGEKQKVWLYSIYEPYVLKDI